MNSVEEAQKFFHEVVEAMMIGDLDNMVTKIPVVPNAGGNCNFPITLFIFSCLEFLGYLTSDKLIDGGQNYTRDRVLSYIDGFFGDNYKTQIKNNRDVFVSVFRHGLAHEFFAKAAGVSRQTGTLITTHKETGYLVLDADEFYQAFKASTAALKENINKDVNGIANRIIDRYSKLLDKNLKNFKPKFISADTFTPISGPSIARPLKSVDNTGTAPYPLNRKDEGSI